MLVLIAANHFRIKAKEKEIEAILASQRDAEKENRRLEDELKNTKRELESIPKDEELRKNTESLFRKRWETLNALCKEYDKDEISENSAIKLVKAINKEISRLNTTKNLKAIEEDVNLYSGNIMKIVRSECSNLSENDYIFIALTIAGFSVRTVCLLTNIKYKNYYLRKTRIIEKIRQSGTKKEGLILQKMGN